MRFHLLVIAIGVAAFPGCTSVQSPKSARGLQPIEKRDNVTYSAYPRWYRSTDVVDVPAEPVGGIAAFISHLDYPRDLRRRRAEGRVHVQVTVDAAGAVKSVRVLQSGGAVFDRIVIRAVHEARWRPAVRAGKAVPFTFTFPVSFTAHA